MSEMHWNINCISSEPIKLKLKTGDILYIVGTNGSGKSALIHKFVQENGNDKSVRWIAAHRRTWLDSGATSFTPQRREEYDEQRSKYEYRANARWQDAYADANLSAVLFDLVDKQSARAESIAELVDIGECSRAKECAAESPPPLNQINEILKIGGLKVHLEKVKHQNLVARHENGNTYSIAEMSDGERSAMIIAAQVITAESGTLFLIDEPERHLHRSIIEPLLSALFALRREDCTFVISTHEVMLPVANPDAKVLMLWSCQWNGDQCVAWDADVLEPDSELPEELRVALLGSRREIIFVEGEYTSLDYPFYSALFPDVSVIPTGRCQEVERAVHGLRTAQRLHHVEVFGIIDRDHRQDDNVVTLATNGVFALDVYSVEGLYYCSEAIAAVARWQASSFDDNAHQLAQGAKEKAFEILKSRHIAKRMAAHRGASHVQELILSALPGADFITEHPTWEMRLPVGTIYCDESDHYTQFVKDGNLDELFAQYPLHKTGASNEIAKALKCRDRWDYEQMVIARIQDDKVFRDYLKDRLRPLVDALEANESSA